MKRVNFIMKRVNFILPLFPFSIKSGHSLTCPNNNYLSLSFFIEQTFGLCGIRLLPMLSGARSQWHSSHAIIHQTSSSSHAYDVFVSFRGEDTRNNFTSFLFGALRRQGILAFKDDQCIKKGDFIAPELLQAIQGSQVFVVVLSKNYASSTWCLRELVEIFNCCQTSARPVIPIFYDVEPTTVRNQKGCYEKAFAEHENRFREDKVKMEEVQRWKEALRKVADISGSEIGNK